jgi:hypothetical protein
MFKNVYLSKINYSFRFPNAFLGGKEGIKTPGQFYSRIFRKL